ncbi:MAG: hypothetical protein R2745_08540 [Vicinamibacterales bacterium]
MAVDVKSLFSKTKEQLDELFRDAEAGPIPNGKAKGTALIVPGTAVSDELAEVVNLFVWKGKSFDAEHGTLRNRISVLGFNAIVASVYHGKSLLDDKPCVVLDYSKTSLVAKWIRDEIRLISPHLYLGRVYWDNKPILHFALEVD